MLDRLYRYLVLPTEVTPFEADYLAKTNRVALVAFTLHVPLFGLVAFLNGTGWQLALALTSLAVVGPVVATRTLANPRHVSLVSGVASMFFGALLVHFGRGLWTIEMHFYFFVALALLAVFANPMVILAAAATVTLHHLLFWAVLPESVFNYDAPLASVLLHAVFVVLESVAACYVGRSFFDNVIGLERIVKARTLELDARNRDVQLVLDTVRQGLVVVSGDGRMSAQVSRALVEWFGEPPAGASVWEYLGASDATFRDWMELGWLAVQDGVLPPELAIAQLPARLDVRGRNFEITYQPVDGHGQLLVVVSDASERVARSRTEVLQRETVAVFEHISKDRAGFAEFFAETTSRIDELAADPCPLDARDLARAVHTIKGTAALFGVVSVADACQRMEARGTDAGELPTRQEREALAATWRGVGERVSMFLDGERSTIEVRPEDVDALLRALREGRSSVELEATLLGWKNEPTGRRLGRFAEQARALAERLGVGAIDVDVIDNELRLPREPLIAFWSSLVHVVRNAVDHGLGSVADGPRRLTLSTERIGGRVVVTVGDTGGGIDWDAVRERARALGVPSEQAHDLENAIFRDGLSTCARVTEISGRGVGLAAVRAACDALGADIRVDSVHGSGTCFRFELPAHLAA